MALGAAIAAAWPAGAPAQEALPVLASVGPWPAISRLIEYGGRIWFANSVKGRNHNAADIYSFDPASGEFRYERQLFSQDAGRPLVDGGLLYWPFEDARFSLGWGHFMVTDGQDWRLGVIPSGRIFHNHAMGRLGPSLIAATSAWQASLQSSDDSGRTWRQTYAHPTPPGRVTRIVSLQPWGEALLGALVAREDAGPLLLSNGRARPLPGWPRDQRPRSLTVFRQAVYGLVPEAGGLALWRSDGSASQRLRGPDADWPVRLLAAGLEALWALTEAAHGWLLWSSPDGLDWRPRHRLAGGRPNEILVTEAGPFVAGSGEDGRGIVWGPAPPAFLPAGTARGSLPPDAAGSANNRDWGAAAIELEHALAAPESYAGHGRMLRDLIFDLARDGPPPGFFAERLDAPMPSDRLSLIGGATQPTAAELGRWILLWGMAVSGHGRVPQDLISALWNETDNGAEKYFASAPAAIWAAGSIGQRDRATLDALIARLGRADDPPWLRGDIVGALTALTGQRFANDVAAWQDWWQTARQAWPD